MNDKRVASCKEWLLLSASFIIQVPNLKIIDFFLLPKRVAFPYQNTIFNANELEKKNNRGTMIQLAAKPTMTI